VDEGGAEGGAEVGQARAGEEALEVEVEAEASTLAWLPRSARLVATLETKVLEIVGGTMPMMTAFECALIAWVLF
jgi:hypothetical protein